ncbi:MAG: RNA polymerase sigma factor [Deltaproteobacteria bacterium]|nr:RNA polymerase sigma factor [Deltaproteobacteria bacterium]MCL5276248.1 RNA polymerase sigma factor [Deltaproteobacteria bacterium]
MDDDTKTMLRLKNGERAAFDELYDRFSKKVYNYVLRFVGSVDVSEDITQEVFVKMYMAAKTYEPTAKFSTWLFTIATNLAINEHHKSKRVEPLEADSAHDDSPSPDDRAALNDMEQSIMGCIQKLPVNQKTAILLRGYEGMNYADIARVLNISEKAVKSLLSRARGRLMEVDI